MTGGINMALIQMHFLSTALKRTVPVTVILPVDNTAFSLEKPQFPTLYLLHGLLGNHTDWVSNTRIQRWAEERGLAVVMPSGDNSFYIEQTLPNQEYGKFIGQELVEITRRAFPLSQEREKTFLAGLSMGGFGAMRNGLKYCHTFGSVASLSGALHFFETPGRAALSNAYSLDLIFGDMKEAEKSDKNPRVLANALKNAAVKPRIYMACGTEDGLLPCNRITRDFLLENNFDLTYEEFPGDHNWAFWDMTIERVLKWLPPHSEL